MSPGVLLFSLLLLLHTPEMTVSGPAVSVLGSPAVSVLGRPAVSLLGRPAVAGTEPSASAAAERAASARDASSAAARVDAALAALSKHVREQSHPEALRMAFQAYYNYAAAHPGRVKNPYFYYVDFGLDNRKPRGYVFDMRNLRLVEGPFTVAHGSGSSSGANGVPTRFSNQPGSNATSLGLYLTQETYRFSGKSNGRAYTSVGLRLEGLSGRYNNNARRRGIVVHGAPYVTAARAGRSQGCPAMEMARAQRLLPMIANGGLVFHFSPRDVAFLSDAPWVNAAD